ncbi:MAG TPA: cysteine methyltransferase [Desulfobulbaceae bacterium]|nr:cysteine methyltransferase [Desulfobulbaceae bacterium]
MNALEIKKMSTVQRLQAMENLWDALLHEKVEIESPGWHQNVLKNRKKRIAAGEAEFLSLKELKAIRDV